MKIANTSLQEYMGDVKATKAKLGLYSSLSEARDLKVVCAYYHKWGDWMSRATTWRHTYLAKIVQVVEAEIYAIAVND